MQGQLDADPHSIIHAVHDSHNEQDGNGAVEEENHFMLADNIMEIDTAAEVATLHQLQDKPILLLDNLVHAVFPNDTESGHDMFWQQCIVLNTTAYTAVFDVDGNMNSAKPMVGLGLPHQPARLRRGSLHRHQAS